MSDEEDYDEDDEEEDEDLSDVGWGIIGGALWAMFCRKKGGAPPT